jgi:GNAT superfamily N-acetyltransferase
VSARVWVADVSEAETVARLLVGFRDLYGRDWPSENSFLASVETIMETRSADYLLGAADDDSPPAGVCVLRYRHSVWMAADDCWLEDLFVEEPARGAGLGAALMEAALERARERGCRRVELDANERNAAAIALYRRFGFSEHSKGDPEGRDLFFGDRL